MLYTLEENSQFPSVDIRSSQAFLLGHQVIVGVKSSQAYLLCDRVGRPS